MYQRFSVRLITCLVLMFCIITTSSPAQNNNTTQNDSFCWKANFGRGAGTLPNACPNGYNKELAACYTTCKAGFEAWSSGAVTCEQQCPAGFTDNPGTCLKPAAITSPGYPWKFGDRAFDYGPAGARCNAANPGVGCQQTGLIWYPNCPTGYHKFGAPTCTPDCPASMTDSGAFCSKKGTYTRAMTTPGCPDGMSNESGLCYSSCGDGYKGNGPVCWGQCPSDHPFECGAACAVSQSACAAAVGDMVTNTVSAALTVASFAFGGPGVFTGIRAGIKAARAIDVAEKAATTGESVLMTAARSYTKQFGKSIATKMMEGMTLDNRNLYFTLGKRVNSELGTINRSACEFGAQKDTGGFDLNELAALDPTGMASMVTSFTKYGSCNGNQFYADTNELNFGNISSPQTRTFNIIAQQPTVISRVATPVMLATTITPSASCIGRKLRAGESCQVSVTVQGDKQLDAEVDVYSDVYQAVPYAVHLVGNTMAPVMDTADQTIDEAANLTDVQGVWAYGYDQTKKVVIDSRGLVTVAGNTDIGTNGIVQPAGNAGRAFAFNTGHYQQTVTLNDTGDRLTSAPLPGVIGIKGSSFVLSLNYYRTDNGTPVILWTNNNVMAQNFSFVPLGDGTYKIVSGLSGKVLHVQNSTMGDGGAVVEWDWQNLPSEKWKIDSRGDGSYVRIVNVNSNLALTVSGGVGSKGGALIQSEYNDLPSQQFTVSYDYGNFVRRPWDAGCNPGETNYAALCYDVPYGWSMTSPGIMGKVCPADWRDDGISCWPIWKGDAIPAQADPNGGETMRHPIMVTDTRYTSQSCPVNYYNSGGFTCTASISSKQLTSLIGHLPN